MMNKILVRDGIVQNIDNDDYVIDNNKILFKQSGTYYLEYLNNMTVDLEIEIDGGIDVLLIETSFDNKLVINNYYKVKNGMLNVNKFYGNKSVNEQIKIDLIMENARIDYSFANICLREEKYVININHLNKNTFSNVTNKAVALNNSKLDFEINSTVVDGMDDAILDQTTRVITFGECDVKVRPNMFVDFDNVIAKHGSVIGTIKDELIFYLMSRGICYDETVKLIIKGYLLMNSSFSYDLRSKIIKKIEEYWR